VSEALDKARAALLEAADHRPETRRYLYLLEIARVNCELASAEAMERIAAALERVVDDEYDAVRTCDT
jgi:hypothetical protein